MGRRVGKGGTLSRVGGRVVHGVRSVGGYARVAAGGQEGRQEGQEGRQAGGRVGNWVDRQAGRRAGR